MQLPPPPHCHVSATSTRARGCEGCSQHACPHGDSHTAPPPCETQVLSITPAPAVLLLYAVFYHYYY